MSFVVDWEDDRWQCSLCGCRVGKMTRHHCRLCGRCVCSSCSPSSVRLDRNARGRRACNPCVAAAQMVPWAKTRVQQLAWRLLDLAGDEALVEEATASSQSLESIILRCEAAFDPLEDRLVSAMSRAGHAEAAAALEAHARQEMQVELDCTREFLTVIARQLKFASAASGDALAEMPEVEGMRCFATAAGSSRAVADAASNCEASANLLITSFKSVMLALNDALGTDSVSQAPLPTFGPFGGNGSCFEVEGIPDLKPLRPSDWELARTCHACKKNVGKRYLRRRHHCRLCGRSVCSKCSPSSIQFEAVQLPQRVCQPCVVKAHHSSLASARMGSSIVRRTREGTMCC